jgi:hypothetical protein
MNTNIWPSGDCRPIMATHKKPIELVPHANVIRDRDELDWFEAVIIQVQDIGPVLLIRYDNIPTQLTEIHVDIRLNVVNAQETIASFLKLGEKDIGWRLTS